jgi:hypothetical protein
LTVALLAAASIAIAAAPPAASALFGSEGSLPWLPAMAVPLDKPLAKIWHSNASQHDFNVELAGDVFRATWVNIPPAAAKQGAFIRTQCRRSGDKWVGTSSINMLFAVPGAPPGKDTKLCALTVRFEVDSVTPVKIAGHSESLRNFDVKTCRVQQTSWSEFTWVPKQ